MVNCIKWERSRQFQSQVKNLYITIKRAKNKECISSMIQISILHIPHKLIFGINSHYPECT